MFSIDAYGVTDTDPKLSDEIPYGDDPFAADEPAQPKAEDTDDALAA
jgi:hypothetical protein